MDREQAKSIGIGILLGAVLARIFDLLMRKDTPQIQVLPVPYMPPPPKPETPASNPTVVPQGNAVLLTSNPIPVAPGKRYRVILSVGFPFSLVATHETVRKQGEELGFVDVKVFKDRPMDFPGTRLGDWYLEARWGAGPTSIARPNIPGVILVEAWEG